MTRTLAIVLAVGLTACASAVAHTLPVRSATRQADRYATRVARALSPPPRVSVPRCKRRSRHTVDCVARFRFASGVICQRTVRVAYSRPTGHRVHIRFLGNAPDCF